MAGIDHAAGAFRYCCLDGSARGEISAGRSLTSCRTGDGEPCLAACGDHDAPAGYLTLGKLIDEREPAIHSDVAVVHLSESSAAPDVIHLRDEDVSTIG